MSNTGSKIVIWQLQNATSNFPKLYKVCAQQKSKKKSGTFVYKFSRNICFNSEFKNRFQVPFMVKVINTKKIHYMHLTLYSHILKNKPTPFSCRFKYALPVLLPIIKGLIS